MLNAIRYLVRAGCRWRMLPVHFGPWQTVYWWLRRFVLFQTVHDVALMLDREQAGREASPSAGVLDSQTVKAPLHRVVLHAYDRSHRIALGSHRGTAQDARASAGSDPGGGAAHLAGGGGHCDVVAEAEDIVECQLVSHHPVELVIAEPAISHNACRDVRRQSVG